jgi:hypothetical protein
MTLGKIMRCHLLLMKTKDGSLSATYNDKGKLIRVVEEYKNVRLQ